MTQHGGADAALAALTALPLGVWVMGADQRLAFSNATTRQVTGLAPDDLPPGTPLDVLVRKLAYRGVYGHGDPEMLAAEHLRIDRSRPFRRRLRRTDGACFEQIATPLPQGGYVSVLVEVTGYLAATEEAQAQALRLENLLSRLHGGIAAYDQERRLFFTNPAYEDLLGLPRGAVRPGITSDELYRLLADRGEFANQDSEAVVADRQRLDRSRPVTYQRVRPNGQVLRFESQPIAEGGHLVEVIDITAAKRAEDEAQRRAALLDGVLASLPHGVVVYGPDGRVAMVNAAHQAIMAGAEVAVGESRQEITRRRAGQGEYGPGDPEDLARLHLNAPPQHLAPRRRTRPDGTVLDIRYAPLPDGGTVQVVTDITALHAARAEATARAATLQAMLDNMRHGIALYGPDRRLVAVNGLAQSLSGTPESHVAAGRHFDEIVELQRQAGTFGDGPEAAAEAARIVALDRSRPIRYQRRTRDGRIIEVHSDPTPEGGFVLSWTDITARAQAEAAAEQRAAMLRVALDSMRHGFILYDAEARLVAANALAASSFGLRPEEFVPGRPLAELARLQWEAGFYGSGEPAEAELRSVIARDRRQPHETRRSLPDGRVMEARSAPTPDGGFVITLTDITALARAEAAARERANLLQTMQDCMRHGLALFGPDQRLVIANRLAAGLAGLPDTELRTGMTPEELAARQLANGVFGAGPEAEAEARSVAARDRTRSHPVRRRMPDGRVVDSVSDPTPDGGFVITWTDVTAQVAAEAAAEQRAATLQAMIDNMHNGVVLFGADRRLLADNRLARELTGIPDALAQPGVPFDTLAQTLVTVGTTGDPDTDRRFVRLARESDRSRPLHYTRPTRDGRTLEVFSDPMPDGGFVITLADITPLARAEAEAKQRAATQAVMLDVIRHGIALFGPDRRLIAANRLASELSGVPAEEMHPGLLFDDAVRQQLSRGVFGGAGEELARMALTVDRTRMVRYHRRVPDGRLIEVVSDPTPDGGFALTYSDITALAAAEEAAASRASLLQAALDNMRHGLLIYGPDRRLRAFNALAVELAGLRPGEVTAGARLEELVERQRARGHFGPEPAATLAMERLIGLDRSQAGQEMRELADGRRIEVYSDPAPDGGFLVSFTDVTALARAEAEARQQAAMMQAALHSMRHALMLFGPDRRLLTANRLAGPCYGIPDLAGREGALFDDLVREQHATGQFGEGEEARAQLREILAIDRSRPVRYRRIQADGTVVEVGSDPTPEGGFVVTHTDVTELARAQAEATARAGILQLMLDNMRHGIAQFDRDKRLVMANRLAAEFNGIGPELLRPGVHAAELASAAVEAGMITPEVMRAGLNDDYSVPQRRIRLRPDGRVIEVFTDPTPDGGFVATYSDITALTEAEAAARQRASVLQVMLDSMRHGICYYGPDRRVIAANALAADLGGYPAELIEVGVSLDDLISNQLALGSVGGDAEATAVMARSLDRSRPARYVRPNADGRIIEVTSDPTPDGGFVVTMLDISALARAEAEAQNRARILQAMLDNIRHGIALFDTEGRVQAVNPVFLALLDLPQEVMAAGGAFGRFIDHLQARGEYGEGEKGAAVAAALKTRDRRQPSRNTRTRPNGMVLEIASEPVPGGGWVLALTDVSEDRRIRAELERAKDAAEAANKAKSRFLATMSHELRTPLNAVIGFSEAITVDPDPERGKEYVRSIHEAGRHLLSLIDDILDATRAETTGFPTVEGEVEVIPLVEGVVRVMQATAATAGVAVQAVLPPVLPALRADELRLRQVLLNLVSNAVKFTPQGGLVTVSAELEVAGDLVLRVADSGIGMKAEDIPRAFEPFTQLDSSLARRFPGSGLGLYLSRALAEAQGATLTLESVPGAGTTAVLRFPGSRLLTSLAA